MRKALFIALLLVGNASYAGGIPATVADLGLLDGDSTFDGTLLLGEGTQWLSFSIDNATYLDIAVTAANFDSELGLFDDLGFLQASDDDGGIDLLSCLSFGASSLPAECDGFQTINGALGAGTYYLAVSAFDTVYSDGFNADPGFSDPTDDSGPYSLSFFTDSGPGGMTGAPEPGILMLLGLGLAGLGFTRRRS